MVLGAQDMPSSRTIDITLTEGTSMSVAASPDRRWLAIDLLGALWILPMQGGQANPSPSRGTTMGRGTSM